MLIYFGNMQPETRPSYWCWFCANWTLWESFSMWPLI